MHPFEYLRVDTLDEAVAKANVESRFFSGGTTLVDLMRQGIEQPARLIDINGLPLSGIDSTTGGLRVGALSRMAEVAAHASVNVQFPAVAQALLASASPQIRNMASIGGNLMQRTRCTYFRDLAMPCNKREPGTGCGALSGENRTHAILGTSVNCIATHPSDLAVSLVAFDTEVEVLSEKQIRRVPLEEFHLLPGDTPERENVLKPGDIISAVQIPSTAAARRSAYLKIRDRASYEFALVSVAAGLDLDPNGNVVDVRIALGGVGTKPWRAREAETSLRGQRLSADRMRHAAGEAMRGATLRDGNAFKFELAQRAIVRILSDLGGVR
ncbi:xanthine dehydrogenase family protein subunit M [Paraburkholderia sp. 22B1P]|uniref:FAD binding domain-containing protein n=1 Tax=Paraburkholderia sp. 22B1P TaxID=3080498 RepID=UPI0030869EA2|nr:xanthine dehydrogenase family protein subunit M [Paraburkholderia sp. 22B1P]